MLWRLVRGFRRWTYRRLTLAEAWARLRRLSE